MKRKILRVLALLPVLAALSGCIVYDHGYDRGRPHYFHDRW
jgi:hypothetical protein